VTLAIAGCLFGLRTLLVLREMLTFD